MTTANPSRSHGGDSENLAVARAQRPLLEIARAGWPFGMAGAGGMTRMQVFDGRV